MNIYPPAKIYFFSATFPQYPQAGEGMIGDIKLSVKPRFAINIRVLSNKVKLSK